MQAINYKGKKTRVKGLDIYNKGIEKITNCNAFKKVYYCIRCNYLKTYQVKVLSMLVNPHKVKSLQTHKMLIELS